MNPLKLLISFSLVCYGITVSAESSNEAQTVTKQIDMEISRASLDNIEATLLAQKNFLNEPLKYLGGATGVTYSDCKVNQKNASVYKKPNFTGAANDVVNDMWNVTLKVTCMKIDHSRDPGAEAKIIDSSGRHLSKESAPTLPEENPQIGGIKNLAK